MSKTKAQLEEQIAMQNHTISDLQRTVKQLQAEVEGEQERWALLAGDYNALTLMLSDLLHVRVGATTFTSHGLPLWDVTDTASGAHLARCKDIAEAYRTALEHTYTKKGSN